MMHKLRANWSYAERMRGDQMWEGPSLDGILSKERSIWYGVIPLGLESAVTGPQVPPHPFTSLDPPE